MAICSDKSKVREYVSNKGFGSLLNEFYGIYDMVEDINWDELPNQYVLKDSLGSGSRSIIFYI